MWIVRKSCSAELLENIQTTQSGREISSAGLQAVLRINRCIPYLHLDKLLLTGTVKRIIFYLFRFPEFCLKLFNLLSFSVFLLAVNSSTQLFVSLDLIYSLLLNLAVACCNSCATETETSTKPVCCHSLFLVCRVLF